MDGQCVKRPHAAGADHHTHALLRGWAVATASPAEAATRVRKLFGTMVAALGHVGPVEPLWVPATSALRGQLRREAAAREMALTEWAIAKLQSAPLGADASPTASWPVVDRWRTRC